jgi:MYXO-CTERM domain-containing protein
MPARRNRPEFYDATKLGPGVPREGTLLLGPLGSLDAPRTGTQVAQGPRGTTDRQTLLGFGLLAVAAYSLRPRRRSRSAA